MTCPIAEIALLETSSPQYQRFVETARKLHYLNDGQARLKELLAPPPETPEQEFERTQKHWERERSVIKAMNAGMTGSFEWPSKEEALKAGRALRK